MQEEILVPFGLFAAVVGIVWLRTRVNQTRLGKNAETLHQLLAKFESGRELAEFMETEGGRQFMRKFEPNANMLGTLATGIVFTSLGLGVTSISPSPHQRFQLLRRSRQRGGQHLGAVLGHQNHVLHEDRDADVVVVVPRLDGEHHAGRERLVHQRGIAR